MHLTDEEKNSIAQRAAGSYAIISRLQSIVSSHRKNRKPEDQVYLLFARLVTKRSWDWDEYETRQEAVLALIPEPFGPSLGQPATKQKHKKRGKTTRKQSSRKGPPKKKSAARALFDLFEA